MNLFETGDYILHSGQKTNFKIECDALTDEDIETLARLIGQRYAFGKVFGVPRGGVRLADALQPYCRPEHNHYWLIVDDVITTGTSMEKYRQEIAQRPADLEDVGEWVVPEFIGVVIFARGTCPYWITPIFQMWR